MYLLLLMGYAPGKKRNRQKKKKLVRAFLSSAAGI
jgi:hypothetical protein